VSARATRASSQPANSSSTALSTLGRKVTSRSKIAPAVPDTVAPSSCMENFSDKLAAD
jgi:hypothetical protein